MPNPRLEFALERLSASDWRAFERFASEFLAAEYPSLREMASPAGDKGRDAELFTPHESPTTRIQYSVTVDWRSKINKTLERLNEAGLAVDRLIYATNQVIGPGADDLVSSIRINHNIALDVLDRSWFIAREKRWPSNEIAAEDLTAAFVEPLLSARKLRSSVGISISEAESRIALLHLALDAQDEATDKGLTRASFESLVLAALHDTDSDNRLSAEEVIARVKSFVPAASAQQVEGLVRGILSRMAGKRGRIKHRRAEDEYSLSASEIEAQGTNTAEFLLGEEALERELVAALERTLEDSARFNDTDIATIAGDLRKGIETVLFRRGEAFASVATLGSAMPLLDAHEILGAVIDAGKSPANRLKNEEAAFAVYTVLDQPSPEVAGHLRRLADAYTLFAFLRQTADVQEVVLKIFSEGDIWLDTSIVLPLLAETLLTDATGRTYTNLLRAATDAGLRLFVIPGVVEEVERHLNSCLTYTRMASSEWRSDVPFIYRAYVLSGRTANSFSSWLEDVRGPVRPQEDVRDYLDDQFRIAEKGLHELAEDAPVDLRGAVQELWAERHERRRDESRDTFALARLVAHDVENTVGIIQLRKRADRSALGHKAWWLTLDRVAYRMPSYLRGRLGRAAPDSPALSPDFLTQVLRLGPIRGAVSRDDRVELSLVSAVSRYDLVPREVVEHAETLRAENRDLNERVLGRRVRDELDTMRMLAGPEAFTKVANAEEAVLDAVSRQAREARS